MNILQVVEKTKVSISTLKNYLAKLLCLMFKRHLLFIIIVVVPTLLGVLYYGFIASDIYISESKFVIRQPEKRTTSSLGMFLQGAGLTNNHDEIYTVRDYLLSRDVVRILADNLDLQKLYSGTNVDILKRFDPLGLGNSFEYFYNYFKDFVSIEIDTTSSICMCKVKAFTAKQAQAINEAMLFLGEGFINNLNARARQDMIQFNLNDVSENEILAKKSAMALSEYRSRQMIFDPQQQSVMQLQQISKLQSDLIDVRTKLSQYRYFAVKTPLVEALEKRRSELEKEIKNETLSITGDNNSMAKKMMQYDRLVFEVEFSAKRLASAMASLEQSRSEAQRQQSYLERVVTPNLPDEALYPSRVHNVLYIFGIFFVLYGIIKFFIMGIKEHQA
jgi:capsular polysaccharide transport system permease protein